MGTNYYWKWEPCECCNKEEEELHIGKSSLGWMFALRVHPDKNIYDLDDWKQLWSRNNEEGHIEDEYGQKVSVKEMLSVIMDREKLEPNGDEWYKVNGATKGPRNLARQCFGEPGGDTWIVTTMEFC